MNLIPFNGPWSKPGTLSNVVRDKRNEEVCLVSNTNDDYGTAISHLPITVSLLFDTYGYLLRTMPMSYRCTAESQYMLSTMRNRLATLLDIDEQEVEHCAINQTL